MRRKKKKLEVTDIDLLFKKEVCDRSKEIDPDNEWCWRSLSIGWAIAKGMTPEEAVNWSRKLRYDLEYFENWE